MNRLLAACVCLCFSLPAHADVPATQPVPLTNVHAHNDYVHPRPLFDALDHPQEVRGRIEGAFRRPPRPARMAGPDHYYQPYWSGRA